MVDKLAFILNGDAVSIAVHPLKRLLDVLRDDLGLTAAKEGCGEGECGACAILVDGALVNACLTPVGNVVGRTVLTLEGFRQGAKFQVLAAAFEQSGGVQCGFCTPGMILAAEALLRVNPQPDETQIKESLAGNLCRCTGYTMIVEAVMRAAQEGKGLW